VKISLIGFAIQKHDFLSYIRSNIKYNFPELAVMPGG